MKKGQKRNRVQERKFRKKRERERKLKKEANIARNSSVSQFILQIWHDGEWINTKPLKNMAAVERHIETTEHLREQGCGIVEGKIVSAATGRVVHHIAGSPGPPIEDVRQSGIVAALSCKAASSDDVQRVPVQERMPVLVEEDVPAELSSAGG